MNYIFCSGYQSLLLMLYLKNVLGKKLVVVTYSKDVIKYCKAENIDYIQIDQFRPRITSIFKLLAYKKILDDVIKKIDMHEDDNFFLTGKVISYELFYLAKELSKKGNVCYKCIMRELKIFEHPWYKPFISGIFYKFILKIVLGLDVMYYESNKNPRVGIDNTFLEKYGIKEYAPDLKIEDIFVEAVKASKGKYDEYDNIVIDGGDGPDCDIINFDSIRKFYKELSEIPMKFAFKKHPTSQHNKEYDMAYSDLLKYFKEPKILPDHIPVELLCNNIKKNAISIYSVSLITISQLEHLKTISALELVEWYHESYKKEFREHLTEASNNKIIFPKSYDELKEILLNS